MRFAGRIGPPGVRGEGGQNRIALDVEPDRACGSRHALCFEDTRDRGLVQRACAGDGCGPCFDGRAAAHRDSADGRPIRNLDRAVRWRQPRQHDDETVAEPPAGCLHRRHRQDLAADERCCNVAGTQAVDDDAGFHGLRRHDDDVGFGRQQLVDHRVVGAFASDIAGTQHRRDAARLELAIDRICKRARLHAQVVDDGDAAGGKALADERRGLGAEPIVAAGKPEDAPPRARLGQARAAGARRDQHDAVPRIDGRCRNRRRRAQMPNDQRRPTRHDLAGDRLGCGLRAVLLIGNEPERAAEQATPAIDLAEGQFDRPGQVGTVELLRTGPRRDSRNDDIFGGDGLVERDGSKGHSKRRGRRHSPAAPPQRSAGRGHRARRKGHRRT